MPRPPLAVRIRQKLGMAVVDGFFHGASAIGRLHPASKPEKHDVEVIKDVRYRDGDLEEHLLDVYRPRARAERLPVLMYVHGGAFRILSKDTHWLMALSFARQGFLVFNISYRLAPRHPFPAAIEDACAAYEFVVHEAQAYGGDPSTLVLAGESAGGNLATSLTIASTFERPEPFARAVFETGVVPKAVVPACAFLEVSRPERFANLYGGKLSGFLHDRILEASSAYLRGVPHAAGDPALDLADPLVLLERGDRPVRPPPPFFVPCGTADPLLDDSRRLERALADLGVPCEARYYEGELHAFHAFVMRRAARRCWRDTFAFLERALGRPLRPSGRTPWDRTTAESTR